MTDYRLTLGDVEEALSIIREAAQWLIDTGKPMWMLDEITRESIQNPADEFIVLWDGTESVAAMTLSFEDRFFWPDVQEGSSGFIHKLSVRRKFAGIGAPRMLIDFAMRLCRDKGIFELRLDCDPHRKGLCDFYEGCGFKLLEVKTVNTKRLGTIDVAMYLKEMYKAKDVSIEDFISSLASKESVPGGGGASALVGALGAALGSMVSNLTLGKKKYAAVQDKIVELTKKTERLRGEFLAFVDEDAKAFYPLSQMYSLPQNTAEQAAVRNEKMEQALLDSSMIPLCIMEKSCECISLLAELSDIGSKLAVSDVGVGVQLCRSALLGAAMNVYINTKLMKNRNRANKLNEQANALIESGTKNADAVYRNVLEQLIS